MRPFLSFSFLLLAVAAFAQAKKPATPTLDLAEAVAKKMIALEIAGAGGHQGECLKISCRSLTGKNLRVHIPQGQLMDPADSAMQTLVVAEGRTLALNAKTPVEAFLKTFCAQSGDASPRADVRFAVGVLAPENLRQLLKFIVDNGKVADPSAQSAVWCVANGQPLGSIGDPELTKFVAELLGKPAPGYRIRYETRTIRPGERAAPGKALVVEGNYRFYLEKDTKINMALFDATGKFIKQLSKDENMIAGEHRGSLHLEVYNLPPGKYTVRLQTKTGEVVKAIEVEF